jgi:hypothetical protein
MNLRRIVSLALGLFVLATLTKIVVDEVRAPAEPRGGAAAVGDGGPGRTTFAYYFHGNRRCKTCNTIEAYAKEALETRFPNAWKAGRIEWRTINVDEPGNDHLRETYALYSATLILSDVRDGKERDWRDLDEVWLLFSDKDAFFDYVERETREFMEEEP